MLHRPVDSDNFGGNVFDVNKGDSDNMSAATNDRSPLAPLASVTEGVSDQRLTVPPDQRFVVFLIGARINRLWMLPLIFGVSAAMGRMMKELLANPESGLLSYESYGGRTTLMVQYWRSVEDLERYARDRQRQHAPAWREWIRRWGLSGGVGVWHETYVVEPGNYECVYHHMPAFGLGKVGPRVPAVGPLKTAPGRRAAGRAASEAAAASESTAA